MKRCEKTSFLAIFCSFFLQLTIRPLQRFFIIYLLFSFFCRNFASFFVRYSLDNGSIMARWNGTKSSATRSHGLTAPRSLRRRVPPIFPTKTLLASFVGDPRWQTNYNNPQMQPVGDNGLQAFFDILKLPLRGGSLPNRKW